MKWITQRSEGIDNLATWGYRNKRISIQQDDIDCLTILIIIEQVPGQP